MKHNKASGAGAATKGYGYHIPKADSGHKAGSGGGKIKSRSYNQTVGVGTKQKSETMPGKKSGGGMSY